MGSRRTVRVLAAALMAAWSGLAGAHGPALGSPIEVWSDALWTRMEDVVYNERDQEFLVLWSNWDGSASTDVFARRVTLDGATSPWFAVVAVAGEHHADARAAFSPQTGSYLVAWAHSQLLNGAVYARLVAADGSTLGPILPLAVSAYDHGEVDVAYNSTDNEFLVVYQTYYGSGNYDITALRLSAEDGSILSSSNVGVTPSGYRTAPRVVYNPIRNQYLIVYSYTVGAEPKDMVGKVAAADLAGLFTAPEVTIRLDAFGDYPEPVVAAGDDEYLVLWYDYTTTEQVIRGRRVSGGGIPLGAAGGFEVAEVANVPPSPPIDVAYAPPVGFVVVWDTSSLDAADVRGAQVLAGHDEPAGPSFAVAAVGSEVIRPAVSCAGWGDCLVGVSDDFDNAIGEFDAHAVPLLYLVFGDGFTSGDTDAWSTATP